MPPKARSFDGDIPERLTGLAERMDDPNLDAKNLTRALGILARIDRLFGEVQLGLRHLRRLSDRLPAPVRILDMSTGYADIPRAIASSARWRRRPAEITAVARHARTLALAACAHEWQGERDPKSGSCTGRQHAIRRPCLTERRVIRLRPRPIFRSARMVALGGLARATHRVPPRV